MGDASHAELLRLQAELAGTATDPPHGPAAPDPAQAPGAAAEGLFGEGGPCGAGFMPPPGISGLAGRLCAEIETVRVKVRRRPIAGVAVALLAGTVASIVLLRPAPPSPPRPEVRRPAAAERARAGGNVR